jgi:hypothetical protein
MSAAELSHSGIVTIASFRAIARPAQLEMPVISE